MQRTVAALALLFAQSAFAADSIDTLLEKRGEKKKAADELLKEVADLDAVIRHRNAELQKKLADAGIIDPAPAPPAPPPKPVDPLKAKLAAAVKADNATPAQVEALVAVYSHAAKHAKDPNVGSTKQLLEDVRDVASDLLDSPNVLAATRKVATEELRAALGKSSDEAITDAERDAAAALFARLAALLRSL